MQKRCLYISRILVSLSLQLAMIFSISTKKFFNTVITGACLWGIVIIRAQNGTEGPVRVSTTEAESISEDAVTEQTTPVETSQTTSSYPVPTERQHCNFNISNGEKNCIKLSFYPLFQIEYTTSRGNQETAKIPMPSKAKSLGRCAKDDTQQSYVEFSWGGGNYYFKMTFQTDLFNATSEDQDAKMWKASSLQFRYDLSDTNYFPTSNSTGIITVQTDPRKSFFETSYDTKYYCTSGEKINMASRDDAHIAAVTFGGDNLFEIQAYLSSYDFSEAGSNCIKASEQYSAISLGVGAALGCVILLVIIAYAIARRLNGDDSRTGYKSVD